MLMIVRPTPDFGIEDGYQVSSRCLSVVFDNFPDVSEKGLDVFPRGFTEHSTVVLADILTQEVKAVRDMRDASFLDG